MFHQVSSCLTAKEMWDKQKTTHEGTQHQKDNQMGILVNDFEFFKEKSGESIWDLVGHLRSNGMLCNGACREELDGVKQRMAPMVSTTRRLDNSDDCRL